MLSSLVFLLSLVSTQSTKLINGVQCMSIHEIFGDPLPKFSNKLNAASSVDIYFANDYSDYFISINNKTWLQSGSTSFRSHGEWADLKLSDTTKNSGYDAFGQFNELIMSYEDTAPAKTAFSTIFKYYPSNPDLLLFTQYFPNGAERTALRETNSENMVFHNSQQTNVCISATIFRSFRHFLPFNCKLLILR